MPVIWMIDAYRAGERAQVRALVDTLAETLGWEVEIIKLQYRPGVFLPQLLRQTSLRGISSDSAARLQAPWPELIVSCGLRNEPVCRWIRQQSGAYSRYLHLGRPWAPLDSFDLIVTTPQYRFPDRANVVNNTLTLHGITAQRLAQARQRWEAEFAALPGPHIAVIVGGDSGPFTFGPRAARRLAREASAMARQSGASLLISTSSRSSAAAMAALQAELDVPNYFYRWQPDDPANPYLGMLASADQLIVTGDSIAMLSEACATGKPVHIFDLGGMREDHQVAVDFRLGALLYGWLMRYCWQALSRDICLVHQQLLQSGRACWLGDSVIPPGSVSSDDMDASVAAVRTLLGEPAVAGTVE